jgi:DNA modification methylase
LKDIELWQGDCLELMDNIPDKSVDCIITDLPYGQTKRNAWDMVIPLNDYVPVIIKGKQKLLNQNDFLLWCYKQEKSDYANAIAYFNEYKHTGLWTQYKRIIKDNGAIILFGNGMFTADMMESNKDMWRYNLIWEKTQPTGFQNANRMPMRNHEDMCVFYKKQPTYHPQKTSGHIRKVSTAAHKKNSKQSTNYNQIKNHTYDSTERFPKSVWKFAKDSQKSALHPTQKPLALLEELIKTYTEEGNLLLDSCMGSNTAGLACRNLHRRYIGIEKDNDIFQIAVDRMKV